MKKIIYVSYYNSKENGIIETAQEVQQRVIILLLRYVFRVIIILVLRPRFRILVE